MTQNRNGPPIEVEGRAPHHRDRPSTSKVGSHATAYNRTTELTAPSAETPGTTNSRQVSWWETHQFIEALITQANTGPLPPAGTPAWSALADGDPRKLLALAVAGSIMSCASRQLKRPWLKRPRRFRLRRTGLASGDGTGTTRISIGSGHGCGARLLDANRCRFRRAMGRCSPWEPPDEPPQRNGQRQQQASAEPTTWEAFDLGPYLRGEIERPHPGIGISRSDGQRSLYPGREHAIVGETESGKTWFALGCAAAELNAGNDVVYIHYEEPDATSTVEKLCLLGVDPAVIKARFRFVAPSRPVREEWLNALLDPSPTLVIHDGVNEAMALHGDEIKAVEGAAAFRRRLILPCLRVGAATLACDHLPMVRDGSRRDAYGSVHKGNALDGARFVLENSAPFGRRLRGVSYVFVTKDRPGHLRANGRATKSPGKTFMGTLVVDDSQAFGPDFTMRFFAPRDDDVPESDPNAELADAVFRVVAAAPDHAVGSMRLLFAELRNVDIQFRDDDVRDVVDDLVVSGRLVEISGKRGAKGFRAVVEDADGDST